MADADRAGQATDRQPAAGEARVEVTATTPLDELLDRWEAAWSERDGSAFAPLCEDAVQYEDPLTREPLIGVDELAAHAERLWVAFPDARVERAGERLTDGARRFVAAPFKLAGTNRGPLGDLPASNRFCVVHGVLYAELHAGRLLRARAFFDAYDAAIQLGVLPQPGGIGERALLMLRGFGLRARRD